MARTKILSDKKQLSQFMTPEKLSKSIVSEIVFHKTDKVLEPSFGDGSFIINLIESFLPLYQGDIKTKLDYILNYNIWGYELDMEMYDSCLSKIYQRWGYIPVQHNLFCMDFLLVNIRVEFDYVIGNPPFGGTINPKFQNDLEKLFGRRNNLKIKKETYSYFIVKSIELLSEEGRLIFICSDTFKTIKTMEGLRKWLFSEGSITIKSIESFSEETDYAMIILHFKLRDVQNFVLVDNSQIPIESIELTPNFSWSIDKEISKLFSGKTIGDYMICSGGLTTGRNEYFVKQIRDDNTIIEEYEYQLYDDYITLDNEVKRAKNNKLSNKKIREIQEKELYGKTRQNVLILPTKPKVIKLPHEYYRYYNVAQNEIMWSEPTKVIFWDNDGEVVRTYKKNGNWYLGGMGGEKFYNKESMTWQLISSRIKPRYLTNNYIIDNSSPVGILKDGLPKEELYFIMAWCLSDKCNNILKTVLNHTKNIQNKDIERLPYPIWVSEIKKKQISEFIHSQIMRKMYGNKIDEDFILQEVNKIF